MGFNNDIPKTQLAGLYRSSGSVVVKEVPVNLPKEDFCLVKVDLCGICGSDLNNYRGQSKRSTFDKWIDLGYADGHEYTGTVVAVGENTDRIKVGMRVVAECTRHCGTCPSCKRGLYNICYSRKDLVWRGHGGFAQFASSPEHALFPIPDDMSAKKGALVEPAACALRAVKRGKVSLGDHVLIVGGGTIGLLCAQMAKIAGASEVSLVYKYPHQAKTARALGISNVLTDVQSESADVVIDAVGTEKSFNTALCAVQRGGNIALVGSPHGMVSIDIGTMVGKELDLMGSLTYAVSGENNEFQRTIELLSSFDPLPIITHEFPLSEIDKAFKTADDKSSGCVKVHVNLGI